MLVLGLESFLLFFQFLQKQNGNPEYINFVNLVKLL